MIQVNKSLDTPFLNHPRGPHFVLIHQKLLRENKDGEEVYELPLQDIVEYLDKDPEDPVRLEAMALISNNNGMALQYHAGKAHRNLALGFTANEPLVHTDALGNQFLDLNLERLALVLVRNPHTEVKQHLLDFLEGVGLRPNMERLNAEFCVNCGSTK